MLNVELVTKMIKERGWKRSFVISEIGLKARDGYPFLRGEWLPKDGVRKTLLVGKLATLLGVSARKVLLRLEARSA